MRRRPEGLWNPDEPIDVTPEEFEREVQRWLKLAAPKGARCRFQHQGVVNGAGGDYAIDVLVSFELFDGAAFLILVECKRQRRPVERDEVLILEGKLRDVGAHKGMLFSTSGFQDGAVKYAAAHGIATISFIDGKRLYITKSMGPTPEPPPWANLPRFAGVHLSPIKGGLRCHTVCDRWPEAIAEWLSENLPGEVGTP